MSQASHDAQLFPALSEFEIECLLPHGRQAALKENETLFTEGEGEEEFYVILEGELKVTRKIAGEDAVLVVHHTGQFTGALSLFTGEPSIATGRAVVPTRVLRISTTEFQEVMAACPIIAGRIISVMARRRPEADALMQQREKMAALGMLSAGLAHELNNPAAAAQRAAARLRDSLRTLQRSSFGLGERCLSDAQKERLLDIQKGAARPALDTLALSEREDELADWLEERGVTDGCALAAPLAEGGLTTGTLDALVDLLPDDAALVESLAWLGASLESVELLQTVEGSAQQISGLVKAIKNYSYMDQAPQQEISIEESLETTLTILRFKWKHGVSVVRDYAPDLPCITAYGSELNQVWTNLIDNALDALDGKGHLFLRVVREDDHVLVEIGDDGPGIPAGIQTRVFEPFFTTKGVGKGTGLGLDTAYRIVVARHHGDLRVVSEPGDTRFQVRLPISGPAEQS